jgi:uncharacterized protein (TIGR02147 family)
MPQPPPVDVLKYDDPRSFLRAVLAKQREGTTRFGLRALARQAGLPSPSGLSMVIHGKRSLTLPIAQKLTRALELTGKKRKYFLALSALDTASDVQEKARLQKVLLRLRRTKEEKDLGLEQFKLLSTWYYPVIYVLAGMSDFSSDADLLRRKLGNKVTQLQISETLKDLIKLGLLEDKGGRISQMDGPLNADTPHEITAILQYHQQMITFALEALKLPVQEREFNGATIPVPKAVLPQLKEKIRTFRKEINEFASQTTDPGDVYQLNIQFFPLTHSSATAGDNL